MSKKDKIVIVVTVTVTVILIILAAAVSESGPSKSTKGRSPEPLIIETHKACHTGTVIVQGEGVAESVYKGQIDIKNDGKNGSEILIYVDTREGQEK